MRPGTTRLLVAGLLLGGGIGLGPCPAAAEDGTAAAAAYVPTLPPITVIGVIDSPATGRSTIAGEVIDKLPRGNGSLNEILRVLPDVQLGEAFNSSQKGGEILPPGVSIAGGKTFQNNFLIDGIGNNSLLDPAAESPDLVTDVPGHPQERFLGSDLIETLTVYDSNVPARLGGFTGGVIEAQTRDPGPERGGELRFHTTRNAWTRFHIAREERDDFAAGRRSDLQPRFEKHDYGATVNLPLTPAMGLLASLRQLDSRIPLPHFNGAKTQERQLREVFFKYAWDPSPQDRLEALFHTTPYREERFFRSIAGSDYTIEQGGYALQGSWSHFVAAGELHLETAWRHSRNTRSGPRDFRLWAATDSKDWGRLVDSDASPEGGFGDLETTQESAELKGSFTFEPHFTGPVSHVFSAGAASSRTVGTFERKETTHIYDGAQLSSDILCTGNTFDCVEKEQFFTERLVFAAGSSSATLDQVALFGEDLLHFGRLELRPGLRLSYDDLMRNTDLAPRLAGAYDLFGTGGTLLIAGVNRYYGNTLLTARLREAQKAFRTESRTAFGNRPRAWEPAAVQGVNETRFSRLKTPHADEVALGLDQALCGGRLSLKYVHREGRDEFASTYSPLQPDGLRYYTLNNHGRSRHDSYRATWERSWARQFLSVNATYQETTTSNEGYDTVLESEELDDRIWYQGAFIRKSDLPRSNYNRPYIVNLTWITELPFGFSFTNLTRYRSGYQAIEKTGRLRAVPGGESRLDPLTGDEVFDAVAVYERTRHPDAVIFDWKLGWRSPSWRRRNLLLTLEINNVFNARARTGGAGTTFEMGRQFWAGAQYRF